MYLYQLQKRPKGMLVIVWTFPIFDRLDKTNLLGHVRHHQVWAISHWSNHLGMSSLVIFHNELTNQHLRYHLSPPPLLGKGSEPCVDQELSPVRVMAQHPGQHLQMIQEPGEKGKVWFRMDVVRCPN